MNRDLDLTTASREVLLATIGEQQALIAQSQGRIEVLEGQAKPQSRRKAPKEKGPRKTRRHGFARRRMTPTHRVDHAMDTCPDCGAGLSGGWVQRTREVIDIPVAPVQVTEHRSIARTCPTCRQRRVPQADPAGVTLGRQRLGLNLLSLIASLREAGRLPFRTIQWYLKDGASVVPEHRRHRQGN